MSSKTSSLLKYKKRPNLYKNKPLDKDLLKSILEFVKMDQLKSRYKDVDPIPRRKKSK